MTPSPTGLNAQLTLQKEPWGRVGAERIALLAAIRQHGSISAAARALGLSYKGAWDAVQVLNNIFEHPLVTPSVGGRDGGATRLTEAGEAVIEAFGAVQAGLAAAMSQLEQSLSSSGLSPFAWSMAMKTSARNLLRGVVTRLVPGAVNSEVVLSIGEGLEIVSIITRESAEHLRLEVGAPAFALIKSSFVLLARTDTPLRTSARNCLKGRVARREDGAVNSEVTLDLGGGKTMTATITIESANALELEPGVEAAALVKASHVILAVD